MPTPRVRRRQFLTTAAASAFAFHFVPSSAFGANDRLHVAGVGVGGKGSGDIRDAAREGCAIVALCDVDAKRAQGTFGAFPKATVYQDFRVMLDKQKDIDAVMVSTPDHVHAVASLAAMRAGKHVYCQKPLTHSVAEARAMAEVAAASGVATQMGNQGHASESVRRGVELIQAGIIGPVHEVHTWTNRPIWPQGMKTRPAGQPAPDSLDWDLWLGPAPVRPYNEAYVPFKWRGWWEFGTGALGDMACHIMDMPYWSLELGSPERVSAKSGGLTEESAPWWSTVTYEFPSRNPALTFIWYDGYLGPDFSKAERNLPPDDVMEGRDAKKYDGVMVGEKGKLFIGNGRGISETSPASLMDEFKDIPKSIPRVDNEDAEWVTACKGGPAALSNFTYSGPYTEMVLLGNVAIRAGKPIEWDADNLKLPGMPEFERLLHRSYRSGWDPMA